MKRLLLILLTLCLSSATVVAKDEDVITIDVANAGKFATAPRGFSYDVKLAGDCAVRGPDGKDVPSSYDSKLGKMRFLAEVPAGGGKFTIHPGVKSRAKLPAWKKGRTGKEVREIDFGGLKVKRANAQLESDLLKLKLDPEKEIHGRLEITTLKGSYKLELSPLGQIYGCIDDLKHLSGASSDEHSATGQPDSEQLFAVFAVPENATIIEPNPFQRRLRVDCVDFARKNNKEILDLYEEYAYEVTLTWGSPVVTVQCFRKQTKEYYNHNGVNLNEFYIDGFPVQLQLPSQEEPKDESTTGPGTILNVKFEDFLLVGNKGSTTIIHQPDFKKLGIEGPCLIAKDDRIMTVISQTWHQGWRAYRIKAGDYHDTMNLVCDAKGEKKLADWITELKSAE